MPQDTKHTWTEKDIEKLRELHAARTRQAQRTDEALVAPIAPTPGHWIKTPGEYDIHGVDYPELKTPKAKRGSAAQVAGKTGAPSAHAKEVEYVVSGDTYRFRERFKKAGWKWNPSKEGWMPPETPETEDPERGAKMVLSMVRSIDGIRNRGDFTVSTYEVKGECTVEGAKGGKRYPHQKICW